jgi:uncharacterized protein (TIGR02145 family)
MKRGYGFWFALFIIVGSALLFTSGCEKKEPVNLPQLTTTPLTEITSTSFTSGGRITSDGGAFVSARGICWSTECNPTIYDNTTENGTGTGSFTSSITRLQDGTNYYLRAYAVNSSGIAYGNQFLILTTVTDVEGNVYNTTVIGTQVWMTQNLKTTKYNDNTTIPYVDDNAAWSNLSTSAYCWYKNDANSFKDLYGALYNWLAVNTGKLCPSGWHVPNEKEWTTLTDYLSGEDVAGGKLKEEGTDHWQIPNTKASNQFGFTALPGGYRTGLSVGSFRTARYYGWWWTSTEDLYGARCRLITYDTNDLIKGAGVINNGYSVRCLKN